MKRNLLGLTMGAALAIAPLLWPSAASADEIYISANGFGFTTGETICAEGAGSANSGGTCAGQGSFGYVGIAATGSPTVAQPGINTSTLDVSYIPLSDGSAHPVLDVFITETGITGPLGISNLAAAFSSTSSGNLASGVGACPATGNPCVPYGGTVTEDVYIDPNNDGPFSPGRFADLVDTATFTAYGSTTVTNPTPNLTGTYSETIEYIITFNADNGNNYGNIFEGSANTSATSVPEPTSLALLGTALAGFGWVARRRRKNV